MVAAGILAAAGVVAVAALAASGGSEGPSPAGAEASDLGENVPGHLGGEGSREGSDSPSAEQVENRAYPRSYVSDRLALRGSEAFSRLPSAPAPDKFASPAAYRAAVRSAPARWNALGPKRPNVAATATQSYNTATGVGTPTTNSGRVTAMAVDPNCGRPGDGCRLWVAAAGGGIWRTPDALANHVKWRKPSGALPTNSFGSLYVDPNDRTGDTIYAGSGEPNGSSDSEAGLGLFKSTDGGRHWHLVKGSRAVAIDRSIATIAVKPGHPHVIYIGSGIARHGRASSSGGEVVPPNAPALGAYKSTDGGRHFRYLTDLARQTPPNPTPPAESDGYGLLQGGVNGIQIDPNNPRRIYAAVFGYGLWRSNNGGKTWRQIFHTINQNDFSDPSNPGDSFGDRTEFDLAQKNHHVRIYVGDSSTDLAVSEVWRVDRADTKPATELLGNGDNAGWTKLSSAQNGTNGYLSYNYCQTQCFYDDVVVSPPRHPGQLWLGGSMNYQELQRYQGTLRSNGRAVIRSTNANAPASDVTWQDMTQDARPPGTSEATHPDLHAIVLPPRDPGIAFVGSDGGVVRVDVNHPVDTSSSCRERSLSGADLQDCERLLSAIPSRIDSLNNGLNDLQFGSLSADPHNPGGKIQGGTQDNGTFRGMLDHPASTAWKEVVGGDGGQSGFDAANPGISYHTYYSATPEVNFHGGEPGQWLYTAVPLGDSGEQSAFNTPFAADPTVGGRAFIGLQHVWRTDDHGGDRATLEANCNTLKPDGQSSRCGDWQRIGQDLTSPSFGSRAGQYVATIARAPSDNRTLWAATRTGRVFVSENAGDTPAAVHFRRIDSSQTPGRFVSGIAVDPKDPDHAFISYSGFNPYTPGTPGHVFDVQYDPATHTATFRDLSHNLGDQPITGIAFDPRTGDLYAATDFGISRLPAGSRQWEDAAPGLPSVAVYGLTLSDKARTLYAATHGRGAYALELP
jgi:hypothetical protein